jgi:hypothetical protein
MMSCRIPFVESSCSKLKSNGTSHNGSSAGSCQTDRLDISSTTHSRNDDSLWVLEGFLTSESFRGIKREELGQQIKGERRSVRVERLELDSGFDGKRSNVPVSQLESLKHCPRMTYSCARGDPTRRRVSSVGVPRRLRILLSWST